MSIGELSSFSYDDDATNKYSLVHTELKQWISGEKKNNALNVLMKQWLVLKVNCKGWNQSSCVIKLFVTLPSPFASNQECLSSKQKIPINKHLTNFQFSQLYQFCLNPIRGLEKVKRSSSADSSWITQVELASTLTSSLNPSFFIFCTD